MKKIDKIIVWFFVLSPVILISSFVVYSAIFDEPLEEIVMKEDLSLRFYGVIDSLYFNRGVIIQSTQCFQITITTQFLPIGSII